MNDFSPEEMVDSENVENVNAFEEQFFNGYSGGMTLEQSRTLIELLKNNYISNEFNAREWSTLLASPALFRSRLHELCLDLVIDRDLGVARKVLAVSEDGIKLPHLYQNHAFSRDETILLIMLRKRLIGHVPEDGPQMVDREEMHDFYFSFTGRASTDESAELDNVNKIIERLRKNKFIWGAENDDRFRILPIVESVFTFDVLKNLQEWLENKTVNDNENVLEDDNDDDETVDLEMTLFLQENDEDAS